MIEKQSKQMLQENKSSLRMSKLSGFVLPKWGKVVGKSETELASSWSRPGGQLRVPGMLAIPDHDLRHTFVGLRAL